MAPLRTAQVSRVPGFLATRRVSAALSCEPLASQPAGCEQVRVGDVPRRVRRACLRRRDTTTTADVRFAAVCGRRHWRRRYGACRRRDRPRRRRGGVPPSSQDEQRTAGGETTTRAQPRRSGALSTSKGSYADHNGPQRTRAARIRRPSPKRGAQPHLLVSGDDTQHRRRVVEVRERRRGRRAHDDHDVPLTAPPAESRRKADDASRHRGRCLQVQRRLARAATRARHRQQRGTLAGRMMPASS